jgi:hypothetical protein
MERIYCMHQTPAINVWKGSNRVSDLWEELLAIRVSPDPCTGEKMAPKTAMETPERVGNSMPALLEKAGFESLRRIRQALEVLAAPSEEDHGTDTDRGQDLTVLTPGQWELEARGGNDSIRESSTLGLTFIKVSREPEPQPVSAIDTRRMAYGLKIPMKPLHKRPIYQRIFFSLRHMMGGGTPR